ncbi:MAG: hypothetical protein SAL07_05755 [Oscillatoria sp. PMC 1051.18]|nr:hypothetical protein [Oscillatoria sp. PMC 1050.18]MEC5029400.1 hypothetical protein [Oscillatoria sp. PMC 1051.18]
MRKSLLALLFSFVGVTTFSNNVLAQTEEIFYPPINPEPSALPEVDNNSLGLQESTVPVDSVAEEPFSDLQCFNSETGTDINCGYRLNDSLAVAESFDAIGFDNDRLASYGIELDEDTNFRVRARLSAVNSKAIFEVVNPF